MMKYCFCLTFLFFFGRSALAWIPYPTAPFLDDFFGMQARPYSSIRIPEDYHLSQNTLIRGDLVIFEGNIYTEGYSLQVDARKVEFRSGAEIRGFSREADPSPHSGAQGAPGITGADSGPGARGEHGGNGQNGQTGPTGVQGRANPSPV